MPVFLKPSLLRNSLYFLLVWMGFASVSVAQDDYADMNRSKEQVNKVKKYEEQERARTKEKITEMRKQAVLDLERLLKQFSSDDKKGEADLIKMEINKLKAKMGLEVKGQLPVKAVSKGNGGKGNRYFKYREEYDFVEKDIISGKFIFMPTGKVRVIYVYKAQTQSAFWNWEDKDDHIEIDSGSSLGKIIISERPNSNLKLLLVRWGGDLKNILTDAKMK